MRYKKLIWADIFKKHKELKPYSTSEQFFVGDCIEHKSFGSGYVKICFDKKIEVLFEDKIRVLIHKL